MKFLFAAIPVTFVVLIQLSSSKRVCGPWDESKLQMFPGMKPIEMDCVWPSQDNSGPISSAPAKKSDSLGKCKNADESRQTKKSGHHGKSEETKIADEDKKTEQAKEAKQARKAEEAKINKQAKENEREKKAEKKKEDQQEKQLEQSFIPRISDVSSPQRR